MNYPMAAMPMALSDPQGHFSWLKPF